MKKQFMIFIFCIPSILIAQHWKYEEFIPKFKNEILDSTNLKKSRESRILRDLSFTGANRELYGRDTWVDTAAQSYFTKHIEKFHLLDAKDYILAKSKSKRILITNESHHHPEHRVFTASLLKDLYDQGYRYLALEAIKSNKYYKSTYPYNTFNLGDTTIMERGYPLMKPCSGTYVKEPQFGNMIRKAIALGFTLVGYEQLGKNRELYQAQNIARVFEIDPDAKLIVHCGYTHFIEVPIKSGRVDTAMGLYLKEITGFDPFTINQSQYCSSPEINEMIFSKSKSSLPQLLKDGEKIFVSNRSEEQDYWDLTIFHKPVSYVNNRPEWLIQNTSQLFEFDQDQIKIDYPVRIKLLNEQDRLDAVPIDIMEVEVRNESLLHLHGDLESGKIVVENQRGDRQIINVKVRKGAQNR